MVFVVSVTVHVPVPEHPAPLQPANVDPLFGVAVTVTTEPLGKVMQPAPQEIPVTEVVNVPVPVPPPITVRFTGGALRVKVASTVVSAFRVTVHVPVPEHPAPLHPAKIEPLAGVALSLTELPLVNVRHPTPQDIPPEPDRIV